MAAELSNSIRSYLENVWVVTNEQGQDETQRIIQAQPLRGNAIYACGCLFALNIASLNPDITDVCIFDLSDRVAQFWKDAEKIFQDPELNYENAKERFCHFSDQYGQSAALEFECSNNLSFLSTKERFERIQNIFRNNHFSFTKLDLADPDQHSAFLERQKKSGAIPHIIYISNIPAAISGMRNSMERFEQFRTSMELLPKDAIIIDAKKLIRDTFGTQRVHIPPEGLGKITPNYNVLMSVLYLDDYEKAAHCIAQGADVNERNPLNLSPLMMMIDLSLYHSFRALLNSKKADIHARGPNQTSLLHFCALNQMASDQLMSQMINDLIDHGADIDARDFNETTALYQAVSLGRLECVCALLLKGANPDIPDKYGNTPLSLLDEKNLPLSQMPDLIRNKIREELIFCMNLRIRSY